jgi:hypothetical protein
MFHSSIICFLSMRKPPKLQLPFAVNGINLRSVKMQVIFESRDPEGAMMRETAIRRLRFVMRRLSWLVPRATVHLSDVNGPRGGVDKRCQLELKTETAGVVVVTSIARDWHGALNTALARAARALMHQWRRTGTQRAGTRSKGTASVRQSGLRFDT